MVFRPRRHGCMGLRLPIERTLSKLSNKDRHSVALLVGEFTNLRVYEVPNVVS